MSFFYTIDPRRTILSLKGADVRKLLQGLITQDMGQLNENGMVYTWLLNAQSRFLYDFHVILDADGTVHLTPEKSAKSGLTSLLMMYKLRADVTVVTGDGDYYLVRLWGTEKCPNGALKIHSDPRHPKLGFVMICPAPMWDNVQHSLNVQGGIAASPDAFDHHRLDLSIPDGAQDLIKGRTFPLEIPGDAFGAVSFSKGCYLGQELVARTKHQGIMKKTIVAYHAAGHTAPLEGATVVDDGGAKRGTILSVYNLGVSNWAGFARIDQETASNPGGGLTILCTDSKTMPSCMTLKILK